MIGGFGIAIDDTQIVELDGSGHFDLVCDLGDGGDQRHLPLVGLDRESAPRTWEALLSWAGSVGSEMLRVAKAVGAGERAGVEG